MKLYKLVLCSLLSTWAVAPLMAQSATDTTMNRTMLLERDFSPIVQQKNKIDRPPATQEVQQKKNNAVMADWQAITVKSAEIGVMPAGQVVAEAHDADDGYLELSAGNFWNTDLKAGLKWDEFQIDANMCIFRKEEGVFHDVEAQSEGYADVIGLCIRMALLDVMYEKEKPLVIMDDPFASLDKEHLEGAKRFLEEISGRYQILYLTCHETRI